MHASNTCDRVGGRISCHDRVSSSSGKEALSYHSSERAHAQTPGVHEVSERATIHGRELQRAEI